MAHHAVVDRSGEWHSVDLDEFAAAHGAAGGAVVVQETSGAIVAASPAALAVLGLTWEQMCGRTSTDPRWMTVDEQLRPLDGHDHPAMRALAAGRPVRDVVMGVHRPDTDAAGKHVWLSVTALPIRQDGVDLVLTVFSELTGPRAVQLHLMESEAGFRFIAENSTDMVAWQRFDTTYLWVSPSSFALLGYTPEQLIGTRSVDLVHPDDLDTFLACGVP